MKMRKMSARKKIGLMAVLLVLAPVLVRAASIAASPKQTYKSFTTRTPLREGDVLVIGFLGGWEKWDDPGRGVRKFALRLRAMNLPGVHVETVENHQRHLAIELIKNALDRNHDKKLDDTEKHSARIIFYGQSFGGAAVNKASRELEELGVPVLLMVQIDSVGKDDDQVPSNVRRAVNFFQRNDYVPYLRGEKNFRATDPAKTEILGNFQLDYGKKKVDLSDAHWYQKMFRNPHVKMEQDPELWKQVEKFVLAEIARSAASPN
jgi:hypothetical protein